MAISFILNGEDVEVSTTRGYSGEGMENRLVDILRDNFGLLGAKTGCYIGKCGLCSVIFNRDVVKSCLIPAFKIQGSEVITIEGFSQTDEYQDIVLGFTEAKVENCCFCNTGKILATEALLDRNKRPERDDILSALGGIKCRCTEPEELVQGVQAVIEQRRQRLYGRGS